MGWSYKENFEHFLLLCIHQAVNAILIFGETLHDSILGGGSDSVLIQIIGNRVIFVLYFSLIWSVGNPQVLHLHLKKGGMCGP